MGEEVSEFLEFTVPDSVVQPYEVYEALVAARGNVSEVCRVLGARRQRINDMIARIPALKVARDEFREGVIDKAEDNIFKKVEAEDDGASRFVVQTIGKERGWSAKIETSANVVNVHFKEFALGPDQNSASGSLAPPIGGEAERDDPDKPD